MNRRPPPGFIPALRFRALTPFYDRVVAMATREAEFKQRIVELMSDAAQGSLLDLGCGTGTLSIAIKRHYPELSVCGVDADADILDRARRKARKAGAEVRFQQGMADALPFADASFDAVVSTLMFHHLLPAAKHAAFAEVRRVLKPGGTVLIADFGRSPGWWRRLSFFCAVRLLDGAAVTRDHAAGRFVDYLPAAGFEAVARVESLPVPVGQIDFLRAQAPHLTLVNPVDPHQ
jgi:ubiquinone/menaquinone biosynthesis C-methylase UbiE